ncbi:MAG: restriction endonuclease [Candidatus Binatia bacterium]
MKRKTRKALDELPPDLRLILELRAGLKGRPYSHEKIAQVLGVRPAMVREAEAHAYRALSYDPSPRRLELGLAALRPLREPSLGLADVVESVEKLTPELIEHLRSKRDDIRKIRWDVFEHLVGEFLTHQGFKDVRLVGRDLKTSADIYATWVIDTTGMVLRFFVEVKRWKDTLGINVINEVLGALLTERERIGWHAGLIIAAGGFRQIKKLSRLEISLRGVELKDREDLLRWLDGYRPNRNGLWLPAPERALPAIEDFSRCWASARPNPPSQPTREKRRAAERQR